ncbi:hypothetical protein AGMMS50222_07050 [Endomicrobiia bacterium]|nr:hypothetical protein AGMMS49531_06960 [Endomicrobiia bacterium]GHT66131.1 hypothetical protein AGMMS49556_06790 [Endomicrobiia bacterium]GHT70991.1 hypothetical protein AGMMS49950_06880 [Endomicrobiia bacterium]GHT75666.1 hypothetical protein AGMMS50222_07050 [Endomicrobiia bacterium]
MKKIVSFLFCLSLFFVAGCVTISSVRYVSAEYPPTDASKIEVYSTTTPKKEYIELAEITLSSGRELEAIKTEAARLGADAIIVPGPHKIGSMTSYRDSSANTKGVRCVAIKFK